MPTRQAVLLGQDVSQWVVSYGVIEQAKDAMLKTSEIFMPEFELQLDNSRGFFTPGGTKSILSRNHYNTPLQIFRNGRLSFEGLLKKPDIQNTDKISRLVAGNSISKLADIQTPIVENGVNPALAIYSALQQSLSNDDLRRYVDFGSFYAASGPAAAAGALVDLNFAESQGRTLLEIATQIGDACSLTIFSKNNIITCQAFRPYQGHGAELRHGINRNNAHEFGTLETDDSAFANRVKVSYGASSILTLDDTVSQSRERGPRSTSLDGSAGQAIAFADQNSAAFFGGQLLKRSAFRRRKLPVTLGAEFDTIQIGHRHPITLANLGLDSEPMEAIEVRKSLTTDEIDVVFLSLS